MWLRSFFFPPNVVEIIEIWIFPNVVGMWSKCGRDPFSQKRQKPGPTTFRPHFDHIPTTFANFVKISVCGCRGRWKHLFFRQKPCSNTYFFQMWSECGRNVVGMWSKCGRDRRDLDFSKRGLCVSESHTSKALAYDTSCGDHMSQGTGPSATADFSRLFFFFFSMVWFTDRRRCAFQSANTSKNPSS